MIKMQNLNSKFKTSIFLILFAIFYLLFSNNVYAAKIFFEPAENTHQVGETINISVKLDTQGENINAIDLGILYPPLLEVQNISKSGSLVQLWVQEPNYTNTGIFLSGGLPGGIKTSNGVIAKLTLKAKAIGDGSLQLTPASSVLLNDGEGTKTPLTVGGVVFHIKPQAKKEKIKPILSNKENPEKKEEPGKEKGETVVKDKSKPKKFEIFLGQDPRVFEGKYFVSFFTTDVESGIDRYEVKEGNNGYKIAQSPFLLSDQNLRSIIRVRAYDTAGNYRESVYPGIIKRFWLWILRLF